MPFKIMTQAVGIFGMISLTLSYQMKTRKGIILFQLLGNVLFATHYLMLGTLTACILNVIGIARGCVYSQKEKKWASHWLWMALFIVAFLTTGAITYEEPWDILPTCGMIFTSVSLFVTKPKLIRFLSAGSCPLWLVYNAVHFSVGGVINEVLSLISLAVAIVRLDILKKPEGENGKEEQTVTDYEKVEQSTGESEGEAVAE